jgi:hypothetical protein
VGIVGTGIGTVNPNAVVKSAAMLAALYPLGAVLTVVVATAYELWSLESSKQKPEP